MKNLREYLFNIECDNIILTEACDVIADDMINESFKLPILSKLAAKIKEYQQYEREKDVKETDRINAENEKRKKDAAEQYDKKHEGNINARERSKYLDSYTYYGEHKPTAKTFKSMFGPIVQRSRYGNSETKVCGCKWDKLTDENVTYFEGGYEGTLHKLIKKLYAGKVYGMMIVCDPDTDDILYVVRGYNQKNVKTGKPYKPITWQFTERTYSGNTKRKVIDKKEVYKQRRWGDDLKVDEMIELINDYSVYFIEIPNELITEYDVLVDDRKKAQSGILNYDDKTLDNLAKNQRAHYRALAKELRAQRLESNPMFMFDEITGIQNKINELYKKVTSKPEYLEQCYDIGDLMSYVGRAFDYFFRYLKENQAHDRRKKEAEKEGKEYNGSWYKESAANALEDCKESIERIKKDMENIEKRISEIK